MKHARLAALALGACLTMTACGGGDANDADAVDTAGGVVANTPVGGAGTGSMEAMDDVPTTDAGIMTLIARTNDAEVASAQLAEEKAQNAQVKEFARMLTRDHTQMNDELKKLSIQPAATETTQDMKDESMDRIEDLRGKSGADFDRAFAEFQVQAHQRAIERLTAAQNNTTNEQLRTVITQGLPKLQQHLQRAQQLQQQLGS